MIRNGADRQTDRKTDRYGNSMTETTPNNKLLSLIIEKQNLTVANGTDKCKGVITRKRFIKTL